MQRGKYIVIEGGEGCGKTTQAELLYNWLKKLKVLCYFGREPGGVAPAEEMRKILLNSSYQIDPISELFGFAFARSIFFEKIVIPKMEKGIHFISDRSGFSTKAHQGYAGGVSFRIIDFVNQVAMRNIRPDLGIIIDIDPSIGLKKEIEKNRFGEKGLEYHQKVRRGFLEIAKSNPNCRLINYRKGGIEEMQEGMRCYVAELLNINL